MEKLHPRNKLRQASFPVNRITFEILHNIGKSRLVTFLLKNTILTRLLARECSGRWGKGVALLNIPGQRDHSEVPACLLEEECCH